MIQKTKIALVALKTSAAAKGATGIAILEVIHNADLPDLGRVENLVKLTLQIIVAITALYKMIKKVEK